MYSKNGDEKMVECVKEVMKGGIFKVSEYDLEMLQSEWTEINNILALAKADNDVKKVLLSEVLNEFWDDLQQEFYDFFGSQGLIKC